MTADKKNQFAVIDVGSNSVRMVIYDLSRSPPGVLYNEKTFCALGRDLDSAGCLNPEGCVEALAGLAEYAEILATRGIGFCDVVGTAALREARDGAEFISLVRARTGLEIRLISGEEEARYAALGVLSLTPEARGVVADFGGGSLEFARLEESGISSLTSHPYGAYRVLGMGDEAEARLGKGLEALLPLYGGAEVLYTIGGSWRALVRAYMQDHRDGVPAAANRQERIDTGEMIKFCRHLVKMDPAQFRRIYGFEERRSLLAPVSALVLERVLAIFSPASLEASLAGIRDGIVREKCLSSPAYQELLTKSGKTV